MILNDNLDIIEGSSSKTLIIKVVKGLDEEEIKNRISSKITSLNTVPPYNWEIHNIQNDPKWLRHINNFVTKINILTFLTTENSTKNHSIFEALVGEIPQFRTLQEKAKLIHTLENKNESISENSSNEDEAKQTQEEIPRKQGKNSRNALSSTVPKSKNPFGP